MFILPAPNADPELSTSTHLLIPDPAQAGTPGYFLPAGGRSVEPCDYWTRRLRDGDVVLGEEPAPPAP